MAYSPMISLFTVRKEPPRRPDLFVISLFIHFGVIGLIWLGIATAPQLDARVVTQPYAVRHLDLSTPEQEMARASNSKVQYPGPQLAAAKSATGKGNSHPPALRQIAQAQPGPQTLIQPDVKNPAKIKQEVPVPTIVLWTPTKTPVNDIVAPKPEQATAADVTPSLERPNDETNLSDVDLAASNTNSPAIPTPASTTSPLEVQNSKDVQLAPETASQTTAQPTPATVMSIYDLKMQEGTVTLPPVNETARAGTQGAPAPGQKYDGTASGAGDGKDAGDGSGVTQNAATTPGIAGPQGKPNGTYAAVIPGANDGKGRSYQPSAAPIALPKNGHFGSVVVGDSLESEFPELASVWRGRMAYTVYLHVGLAHSWIMQYSLPRDADAAEGGNIAHLDAPWPYNIVRPNLDTDTLGSDALMVHGFVNPAGRFEALSIVFPEAFPQAQFLLSSLSQWQFRPAMQNGQGATVEVLLIIPEELN